MRKRALIAGLLLIGLAACGNPDAADNPTATTAAVVDSTPTLSATTPPAIGQSLSLDQQSLAALERLAVWLQTDSQLSVVSIEEQNWPTPALGCPAPDTSYAQVVTPGALVHISSAVGIDYAVHTSADGVALLCENNLPVDLPDLSSSQGVPPMQMDLQMLAHKVVGMHAQDFNVDQETITVLSSKEVTWSSGALGCPEPGMMYTTVLLPGFQVLIEQDGKQYAYHAGRDGEFFLCERPEQPVDN